MAKKGTERAGSILVVDDEYEMRHFLSEWLQNKGYRVATAKDEHEAQERLRNNTFNLAIVDLKIPDVNGLELVHRIKETNPDLLIIIITAYASIETAIQAVRVDAYDYVTKPLDTDHLNVTIQKGIERQKIMLQNKELLRNLEKANKRLSKKMTDLEKISLGTVMALAATIDARNHHTEEHSERVTKYALATAKRLKFSKKQLDILKCACELHDIGKIAIRDNILSKPSQLTEEEWTQVKRHPGAGANILRPLEFLQDVVPLIRQHHERWNGDGYPNGLREEDILLGARIITVADAYEAMISKRPYRDAYSREHAIRELEENAGIQFDPKVVKAFLKALEEEEKETEPQEDEGGSDNEITQ